MCPNFRLKAVKKWKHRSESSAGSGKPEPTTKTQPEIAGEMNSLSARASAMPSSPEHGMGRCKSSAAWTTEGLAALTASQRAGCSNAAQLGGVERPALDASPARRLARRQAQ